MSCAVDISIQRLLPSIPVYVVAGLCDLRELILYLCAWLFPCITKRTVIGNAVELSSFVRYAFLPRYSHKHNRKS